MSASKSTEKTSDPSLIAGDAIVKTWIHIEGCPAGKFELFIFFDDHGKTKVAHFTDEDNVSQKAFVAILGQIDGYQRRFECGTGA
jgi:hypothetical protein